MANGGKKIQVYDSNGSTLNKIGIESQDVRKWKIIRSRY